MFIIIAPYSPPSRLTSANLGASRKIETIISILFKLDKNIVLVNSAHNENTASLINNQKVTISGIDLIEITPPIYKSRSMGKLKNLFSIDSIINEIQKIGNPQFIWLYNGYAFEMLFALKAKKTFNVPMILEFEDWHFSRGRGVNPKPYIDYFFWRLCTPYICGSFVVNQILANKMHQFGNKVVLLPGIVPQILVDIAKNSLPFKSENQLIKIGFFSGLSTEKGADLVLQLARLLPDNFELHVTGSGPLSKEFEQTAKEYSNKLHYYGRVTDFDLYNIIASCDVILNPHISIENMNNGVFPFKVIEAVASGRLLISTNVPSEGVEDTLSGVQFVEHSAEAFLEAICNSREQYNKNISFISEGAGIANERFGEQALLKNIQGIINQPRSLS